MRARGGGCLWAEWTAGHGRVSTRSVLPSNEAESTAVDYAEQLLSPGMPPLDEIKDLKVQTGMVSSGVRHVRVVFTA